MQSLLPNAKVLISIAALLGIAGCSHRDRSPSTSSLSAAPTPRESSPASNELPGAPDISQWRYMLTSQGDLVTVALNSRGGIVGRLTASPDAPQRGTWTLELDTTIPAGVVLYDVPASGPNERPPTPKRPSKRI